MKNDFNNSVIKGSNSNNITMEIHRYTQWNFHFYTPTSESHFKKQLNENPFTHHIHIFYIVFDASVEIEKYLKYI